MRYLLTVALLVGSCCGITPPTLVSHNSSVYNTSTSTKSVTVAGWSIGDVIVETAIDEGFAGESFSVPTGPAGVTFSAIVNHAASGNPALIMATATATSACSSSCTITQTISTPAIFGMTVTVWRGSSGIGNHGSQFTSARTVSFTPTQADSGIVWTVGDWAAGTVQTITPTPTNTDVATQVGTAYTAYAANLIDQVSSGAVAYGIGGTGTGPFSIGVIEIKGSAGAAPTCTQSIALMGVGCR